MGSKSPIRCAFDVLFRSSAALSIDYSLFMLSRYKCVTCRPIPCRAHRLMLISVTVARRECLDSGWTHKEAVRTMMISAGKTILVSGFTLTFCFIGLCFMNLSMLVAVGTACAMSIRTWSPAPLCLLMCVPAQRVCCCAVVIMTVNFTVCPLMLILFPNFFCKVSACLHASVPCLFLSLFHSLLLLPLPSDFTVHARAVLGVLAVLASERVVLPSRLLQALHSHQGW